MIVMAGRGVVKRAADRSAEKPRASRCDRLRHDNRRTAATRPKRQKGHLSTAAIIDRHKIAREHFVPVSIH
jgi:hypothetical protein